MFRTLSTTAVFTSLIAQTEAIKIKEAAGCPFGFDKPNNLAQVGATKNRRTTTTTEEAAVVEEEEEEVVVAEEEEDTTTDADYVAQLFDLTSAAATTQSLSVAQYEAIWEDINAVYESISAVNGDNSSPRGAFVGCLLRLEGHDFMDYRIATDGTMTGGSDGCINLAEADNTGLPSCIAEYGVVEEYAKHSSYLSLADFFVIIAEAATSRAATDFSDSDHFAEGSLAQKFRDGFKYGRTTVETCDWNHERMPNPEYGCNGDEDAGHDGLKQIFVENIYAGHEDAWTLTAAISGAHTVGSASPANSGYEGHWADAENQGLFNNHYYHAVIARGWGPELNMGGNSEKNQWELVDEGANGTHKEMMLNTDLCLAYTFNQMPQCLLGRDPFTAAAGMETYQNGGECRFNEQHAGSDLLAHTSNGCCAWIDTDQLFERQVYDLDAVNAGTQTGSMCNVEFTGTDARPGPRECCRRATDPTLDCDNTYFPQGPAFEDMMDFMRDEALWLRKYLDSWWAATENNFASLTSLDADTGAVRQTLSDDMNTNCLYPEGQCDDLTEDSPCFLVTAALVSNQERERTTEVCMNKHRPVSEQRPNRINANEWQYASVIELGNPLSSSAQGEYTADRALHPQYRVMTGDTQYAYHANMDNDPWTSSCAVTAEEATAWWSADFVGGEEDVRTVELYFLIGSASLLDGASVYVDDNLCGTVDISDAKPSADEAQLVEFRITERDCRTGSSVRIEQTSGTGLALCGIKVLNDSTFPLQ